MVTVRETAFDNTPRLKGDSWKDSGDCQLPVIRQGFK